MWIGIIVSPPPLSLCVLATEGEALMDLRSPEPKREPCAMVPYGWRDDPEHDRMWMMVIIGVAIRWRRGTRINPNPK